MHRPKHVRVKNTFGREFTWKRVQNKSIEQPLPALYTKKNWVANEVKVSQQPLERGLGVPEMGSNSKENDSVLILYINFN